MFAPAQIMYSALEGTIEAGTTPVPEMAPVVGFSTRSSAVELMSVEPVVQSDWVPPL